VLHVLPWAVSLPPAGTQVLDLEAEKKFSNGAVTIKGFATIDNVCLINIEGTGMVGVPGEMAVTVLLLLPVNLCSATRHASSSALLVTPRALLFLHGSVS
jgi:hypothetical protein